MQGLFWPICFFETLVTDNGVMIRRITT